MPDYRRPRVPGATGFFTVALAERGSRTLVERADLLREAVRATRAERPFGVEAWVVLPDHLHCVWTLPEGDADYSVRWGAIKARFTRAVREGGWARRAGLTPPPSFVGRNGGVNPALRHHKGEVGLWQRRFYERHLRGEDALAAAVRYCWINPVKHGLVAHPGKWPFSSVHRDVREERCGP